MVNFCSFCGAALIDNPNYCARCGAKIDNKSLSVVSPSTNPPRIYISRGNMMQIQPAAVDASSQADPEEKIRSEKTTTRSRFHVLSFLALILFGFIAYKVY